VQLDVAAEVISALRSSSGRDAIAAAVAPVVASEVAKALAEREEKLETLATILGVALDTARKRLKRDHELRALGVVVGRQWKAKRSVVLAHLAQAGARSAPKLRAVGARP
jgi:hypothetical protein